MDYSKLSDLELCVEIAKRKYTIERTNHKTPYWLIRLDGKEKARNLCDNEAEAWADAIGIELPNWAWNANKALELMKDERGFELSGSWDATIVYYFNGNYDHIAAGYDDNPARAISICWLNLQDYKAEREAKRIKA